MEPKHFESLYPENTREKELEKLISILRAGKAAQVVGIPGVGKSNVLRLLPYNKAVRTKHLGVDEKNFHFVYMDFSEVKDRALFEVVKFILISLSMSLGERGFGKDQNVLNDLLKDAITFQDDLILFQALKRGIDYLTGEKRYSVVFLFDRFDEYIPVLDPRFFSNLKILRNRAKYSFSCVFETTRPLEDILEPVFFSDFYEFLVGNSVYLPIFDAVGLPFRLSYLEKITGKKTRPEIKKDVMSLCGGHGKLTRVSYELLLSEKKAEDLKSFLISKNQVKGALFEIWSALTAEEQKILREKKTTEYLENVGLVLKNNLTIPLLEEFLSDLPQTQKEELVFDAQKNEIKKGQEILTEKLSPSEFRLLRFLIINRPRVCEKEEIIENVWTEAKTREGVTDQALDQIIYRLRKKIENDPNNPQHIQTIKGRGYKVEQ